MSKKNKKTFQKKSTHKQKVESEVYNPFDAAFKQGMGYLAVARDLFETYLPAPVQSLINFSTMEKKPDNFIDFTFSQTCSDCLYGVETKEGQGYLYLLVEQQRTSDKQFMLRIYSYILRIIERHLKLDNKHFPLVFPLVYYNGTKTPYTFPMDFWEYFKAPAVARRLMSGPVHLIECRALPKKMPPKSWSTFMELLLRYIRDKEDFTPILRYLAESGNIKYIYNKKDAGGQQYIMHMLNLALKETTLKDKTVLHEILQGHIPKLGENVMGLLQQEREEGKAEGFAEAKGLLQQEREEGKAEGLTEGKKSVAAKMLSQKYPLAAIASITGLAVEELSQL